MLQVPSRNLDLFLQGRAGVMRSLSRTDAEFGILEGAMGYYDGLNGTERASAWEIAGVLQTPAILTLRPKGSGITLAAQVRGLMSFRPESMRRGLILTDGSPGLAAWLKPVLERETELPVLGFLPPMDEAVFGSRHLGLVTAAEIRDLSDRLQVLAAQAEKTVDLDRLLVLAGEAEKPTAPQRRNKGCCRIAVARDEAFCFTYADSLDALREAGAELCFFSPLRDTVLPENTDWLYLPGGYPELHASALAENADMRRCIAAAAESGMPVVAECGGFLYLQESLEDPRGRVFPMCSVLPGRGVKTAHLQHFGYQTLCAGDDSLLFRSGERIPAHEFHYWDSTEDGTAFLAEKGDGRSRRCGYAAGNLYAAFPHLHFDGELPLAERFVKACESWNGSLNA